MKLSNRLKAILLIFIPAAIWGIEPIFVKAYLLPDLLPTTVVFYKIAFASLFLWLWDWGKPKQLGQFSRQDWGMILSVAIIGSVITNLINTSALNHAPVGTVILFEKIQPIFVFIFGLLWFRRRPSWTRLLWVLLAIWCSYLIAGGSLTRLSLGDGPPWVILLLVAIPAGFALTTLFAKQVLGKARPIVMAQLRFTIATVVFFLALILPTGVEQLLSPEPFQLLLLALSGLFNYTLAFILYYAGLKQVSAILATTIELSSPAFSLLLGTLLLAELYTPLQWMASGLLLFSIYRLSLSGEAKPAQSTSAAQPNPTSGRPD